jgi:AcrR family transcriptional regulator
MSKAEITKEKIIATTVKIAMNKGFANTRTAEIAKEAGVSEGLIYKYYPTKNHLFSVIVNDTIQSLKNGVEEIIDNQDLNPTAKLISLINFHFNFFTIDRNIVQLLIGHSDRKSMIDVEAILQQGIHPYVQLVVRILEAGIESGEFRTMDTKVVALAIIGGMQVSLVNKIFLGNNEDLEKVKNELIEFFLAAIKR